MPRPSWCRYSSTPRPSAAIRFIAASSCGPQSQRSEWNTSPVRHFEWTRTITSVPVPISPRTSATCDLAVDEAFVRVDRERRRYCGRQRRGRHAPHQALGAHPVADQIGDRDHQQAVLARELRQLGHARHRAVLVHDLADDARRLQAGDARQIDRRLGVAGAHQHAAVARAQRKHVARARQVARRRARRDRHFARSRARSAAETPVVVPRARRSTRRTPSRGATSSSRPRAAISSSSSRSGVIARHTSPRPCLTMKLIGLGRDLRRRHRQIAFVLAVLVVDDDDHLAGADGGDRVFDRGKRRRDGLGLASFSFLVMTGSRRSAGRGATACAGRRAAARRTCRARRPRG